MCEPGPSVTKHKKGKPLTSGVKTCVLNIFTKFSQENPQSTLREVTRAVADVTGISETSIYKTRKEHRLDGKVVTPNKKRKVTQLSEKYDNFTKDVIRKKVHEFFFKNEIPTLNKILTAVNSDESLPTFSRSTLHRLLKVLNFNYVNRNRQCALIEKDEIVLWRRNYLRQIKKFREEGRSIYYLDETWVNAGHTTTKVWKDETIKSGRHAFLTGLSSGLKNPSGKGKRLIVLHIGNEHGFVEDRLLLFESKSTKDYHEEMDGKVFEKWFLSTLPQLDNNAVIVLDNAPYHSVKVERVPNKSWKKDRIQTWLDTKGIFYDPQWIKVELLGSIPQHIRAACNEYRIDNAALESGRQVLRLPPYHCCLNPIELVWSQVKGHVAKHNKTFKINDVKELLFQGIQSVTADRWKSCVQHVIDVEEKRLWEIDGLAEEVMEPIVINLGDDSDTDTDCSSDMEGIDFIEGSH